MRNPYPNSQAGVETKNSPLHVLLFGIDGARWDIISEAGVGTTLTKLAADGQFLEMEMEVPTISAPGWASILTGTTHSEHGYRDNSCVGGRNWNCPDFLAQGFYRNNTTRTFAAAGWPVLVDPAGLGPIIHPRMEQQKAGLHRVIVRDGETYGYRAIDAEVVDYAVAAVAAGSFDLGFVYACDVDDAGHIYGLQGSEYRDAIRRVDKHVDRLKTAVEQRASRNGENWLVVITTDHGHVDEGGHGGSSAHERASWVISWKPQGPQTEWVDMQPHRLASVLLDERDSSL